MQGVEIPNHVMRLNRENLRTCLEFIYVTNSYTNENLNRGLTRTSMFRLNDFININSFNRNTRPTFFVLNAEPKEYATIFKIEYKDK